MKRLPWILGSVTAIALAACGGGRQNTPGTPESGAAGAPADTTGMAPAPAPTDTSTGAAGAYDTSKKTSTSHDTTLKTGTSKDSAK